eukprot:5884194-Lingulodinium_polyedra.AAC.1
MPAAARNYGSTPRRRASTRRSHGSLACSGWRRPLGGARTGTRRPSPQGGSQGCAARASRWSSRTLCAAEGP